VLSGRSLKWYAVFEVADPDDVVMSVRPGWDYAQVYFEK